MKLFNQKRSRVFNHEYMFVDKRRDRLKAIEDRAKSELGSSGASVRDHEEIRGLFLGATNYARKRKERRLSGGFVMGYGVIAVLLVVLIVVWKMLLSM